MHFAGTLTKRFLKTAVYSAACLSLILTAAFAQRPAPTQKEDPVLNHASGSFEVKVTPVEDKSDDPTLGRMMLDKQYHGDLEGVGKGQMLTAGTPAKGAGGYVAIEKVTGTLNGRSGTFVLQHNGIMSNNTPQMTIIIVPESGTGQLEGIAGKLTITIAPTGKHSYNLEYTLPTHM